MTDTEATEPSPVTDADSAPPAAVEMEAALVEMEAASVVEMEAASVVEMETAPGRRASDAYVFAALVCAVVGILIPILPATAALMLLRATDEDLTGEPLRPQLTGVASFARGLAWFDLAWMTLLVVALLLGILGRTLT